jgi:ATP-dependent DNA helicase PIF1
MKFSEKQQLVLERVWKGHNVFMTGPGGCGKSVLVRELFQQLIDCGKRVQVTAMTGCAAVLLACRARTVHSFAGIGLGNGTIEDNVRRVADNYTRSRAWRQLDVLIVDEVSMMSKKLFEMLDAIARHVRKDGRPFGGLQVVFSGDFYQIRPIGKENEPDTGAFCFESPLWNELFGDHQIVLNHVFRQSDPIYAGILNQIRKGTIDPNAEIIIRQQIDKPRPQFRPTRLFPTRRQVEQINQKEISMLPAETEHVYILKEETQLPMSKKDAERRSRFTLKEITNELISLKKNMICEDKLHLREGSHVMCIINKELCEDVFLCNGSQGVVVGFTPTGRPIVNFFSKGMDNVIIEPHIWESEIIPGIGVSQIPLILSWAITIHKAQGATLDSAEIDVGASIFECGQSYVGLSRIRSLEGLFLQSFDPASIYVNPKVNEFYTQLSLICP